MEWWLNETAQLLSKKVYKTIQFLSITLWVSSNDTHNILRPSKPEKEVYKKATDLKVYACSDISLGEVIINDLMFWE